MWAANEFRSPDTENPNGFFVRIVTSVAIVVIADHILETEVEVLNTSEQFSETVGLAFQRGTFDGKLLRCRFAFQHFQKQCAFPILPPPSRVENASPVQLSVSSGITKGYRNHSLGQVEHPWPNRAS